MASCGVFNFFLRNFNVLVYNAHGVGFVRPTSLSIPPLTAQCTPESVLESADFLSLGGEKLRTLSALYISEL